MPTHNNVTDYISPSSNETELLNKIFLPRNQIKKKKWFKNKSRKDKMAYAPQTTKLNHRDYEHDSHRGSIISNIEAQYDLNSIQLS